MAKVGQLGAHFVGPVVVAPVPVVVQFGWRHLAALLLLHGSVGLVPVGLHEFRAGESGWSAG